MTRIVRTPDVLGGEPRIEGTRIGILDVYEFAVAGGYPPADVADQLSCSLADVYTALAYYHEHPEEMRELRRDRDEMESKLGDEALKPPEPAR